MKFETEEVVEIMCTESAVGDLTEDVISGELFRDEPGRNR